MRLLDFMANELGTSGRFQETAADRDVDRDMEAMLAKAEVLFLLFERICKRKENILERQHKKFTSLLCIWILVSACSSVCVKAKE